MKDRIVVVTGANIGMGKVTALELAKKGAHIVMVCRNKERGETAKNDIIKISGNKNVDLLIADLSLQKSVKELAEKINTTYPRVDVLVNNAGLALTNYSETKDGIETTFATNVLSMYMLSILLADSLKKSDAGRIVNVASSTHTGAKMNWDDIGYKQNYKLFSSYNQSKLCNIVLTYELAKKLKGTKITVNTLNPGPVKTELARDMGAMFKFIGGLFFLTPEKASETAIYLTSSQEVNGVTGKYFAKNKPIASSKTSTDAEVGKKLWTLCAKMTNTDLQMSAA
jgi:NAD(P)-dependent dehydrogenase (short-subunit alcohol dehydrogenase family)